MGPVMSKLLVMEPVVPGCCASEGVVDSLLRGRCQEALGCNTYSKVVHLIAA